MAKKPVFDYPVKDPSPEFERDEEIADFEDDPQYIQDFYGNDKESHRQKDDEEPLDLDYSYSHLEDFLRSQKKQMTSGPGSLINTQQDVKGANATTTQQLMNTFLTSYNKNKAMSSARQEPIAERRAEESGSSDG